MEFIIVDADESEMEQFTSFLKSSFDKRWVTEDGIVIQSVSFKRDCENDDTSVEIKFFKLRKINDPRR